MIKFTRKENKLKITLDTSEYDFRDDFPNFLKVNPCDLIEYCTSEDSSDYMDITGNAGLTSSPVIAYGVDIEDDGDYVFNQDSKVYWYPNYMIVDPIEELYKNGVVYFQKADKD